MKISAIGFAIALLAFLLPFMVIKCGDTQIVSMTGLKLATGGEVKSPLMESMQNSVKDLGKSLDATAEDAAEAEKPEETKGDKMKPNLYAMIALAAAVLGLAAALLLPRHMFFIPMLLSLVGGIGLLMIKTGFSGAQGLGGGEMQQYSGLIKFQYKTGFFISLLGFAVGAALAFWASRERQASYSTQYPPYMPTGPSYPPNYGPGQEQGHTVFRQSEPVKGFNEPLPFEPVEPVETVEKPEDQTPPEEKPTDQA